MLAALQNLIVKLGKFFLGIFAKTPIQPAPTPTPIPTPTPTPTPKPIPPLPPPPPPPVPVAPQSVWWQGGFAVTQAYGCTDYAAEGASPRHPECPYWHDGIDFALPMRTPLYAGRDLFVVTVGIDEFGTRDPYALILWTGNHDIWMLHLDESHLTHGQFVKTGQLLGYSGTRGNSTGPHLHFQINPHGGVYRNSVDPHPWLLAFGTPGAASD